AAFERVLPELGQPVVASPDGPKMYWEANFERPCVLIFGKESAGLSDSIRKNYAECLVQIPIEDFQVRSINLSTCVGIVVYEAVRQRATSQ
ncbi:MAG: TrmH family RNA methyltransferase, partial [Myxococcota bacterium]